MRPENVRMKRFLADNGIQCRVKYIADGSLQGTWRLYDPSRSWTPILADRLDALGFRTHLCQRLGNYNGNGGRFAVFVRGHNELLREA